MGQNAYLTCYQFTSRSRTYSSQILKHEDQNNLKVLRPVLKEVILPNDNLHLHVTCFNFTTMLTELLNDKDLNKMESLVVNRNIRFSKYESDTGKLGEVKSGNWTSKHMQT